VRDDGVGFDAAGVRAPAVRGASLGLLSMEARAELAGGWLEYDSTPGRGTEVRAWFPLKWARPAGSS
jgi:signal transduction histidine kinase